MVSIIDEENNVCVTNKNDEYQVSKCEVNKMTINLLEYLEHTKVLECNLLEECYLEDIKIIIKSFPKHIFKQHPSVKRLYIIPTTIGMRTVLEELKFKLDKENELYYEDNPKQ